MTRLLISFGMLLVFSHSLWAQLQSYIEDASGSFGATAGVSVVRNYNDEYAIGFFREASTSYFYAVKTASGMGTFTQGNKLAINGIWDIKDIFFHNGEAFFCGSVGIDGIIGHFPVSNLINGSGGVALVSRIVPNKPLRRLVAYGSAPSYHVVAIDSTVIASCDFTSISGSRHYLPLSDGELVYDVLLKGDTLLFVGTDTTYNCVTVRRSSCSVPIPVSNPWRYHPATPPARVITTGSIATLLPNDKLAVVHQIGNEHQQIEVDLLTIQLSDMQCTDRQAFVNLHRVHYHDLKYIPATQRLELLYTDFVLFDRYVLEWQPYLSTTYSANVLQPVLRYNSLDRIGDKCFFMVSGFQWMLQNTLAGSWENPCEMHWLAPIINKQTYNMDNPAATLSPGPLPLLTPTTFNIPVTSFNVAIDCLH